MTNALIPLYAVGVFTSFTLSQLGMVRYQLRKREGQAGTSGATISGVGATATFVVLAIVAITKFTSGAWVPVVVIPVIVAPLPGHQAPLRRGRGRAARSSPAGARRG